VNAGDGRTEHESCAFGWGQCAPDNHCLLHAQYSALRGIVNDLDEQDDTG
jgi:hypothetical protein